MCIFFSPMQVGHGFPGVTVRKPISARSTFKLPVKVVGIESSDPRLVPVVTDPRLISDTRFQASSDHLVADTRSHIRRDAFVYSSRSSFRSIRAFAEIRLIIRRDPIDHSPGSDRRNVHFSACAV